MGTEPTAVSPGECFDAWPQRDIAVAGVGAVASACAWLGGAFWANPPGGGRIGAVDNRDEEHRIRFVLPGPISGAMAQELLAREQLAFKGNCVIEEEEFLHKKSRTLIAVR